MAYIGNTPAENYASFLTETFTVSATANYTLSHAVTNENDIRLVINGVVQQPGSGKAYTASGTTLTLTSATVSGDVMYAVYLGRALQTVNPPNASVGSAQIADDLISGKTALGATPADTDELLISDAGTLKRVDYSHLKVSNTPSFFAYRSSSQEISQNTQTKVDFNTESYDDQSTYNTSNQRFTPAVAGKYFIFTQVGISGASRPYKQIVSIYKNGSIFVQEAREIDLTTNWTANFSRHQSVSVIDIADTDDYYEVFILGRLASAGNVTIDYNANNPYTHFGAYKLIT